MKRGETPGAAPWIQTINRLLGATQRPDPRPKPGHKPQLKYWNQSDLVVAADIRGNTLSDIMRGKRKPSLETLEAVAGALEQPSFIFLMDVTEAEHYARFRQAHTAEERAAATKVTAEELAAELAPEIATMIERHLAGQSVARAANESPGRPILAHSTAKPKQRRR